MQWHVNVGLPETLPFGRIPNFQTFSHGQSTILYDFPIKCTFLERISRSAMFDSRNINVQIYPWLYTHDIPTTSLFWMDKSPHLNTALQVNFDDNASYRQKEIHDKRDVSQENPIEVQAKKYDLNYIKLDSHLVLSHVEHHC